MNKQEIQQVVESYIKNENARYALLISGAWGCGKTFLYENYLADAISALEVGKNNRKTNIYISLYGMNSIEALSKQLLSNYLIYAKANGNDIVRKGVKAVSGILGAASRAFSFSAGAVSMDLEKLNELSTTIEVKDLVICFDDLERCSISISEVFGYINNLIEHCNCKVIILADEDNIGKTYANINVEQKYQTILTGGRKVIRDKPEDKTKRTDLATDELTMKELKQLNETLYSENYIYRDIKEKVIGKTCKYTPGIEESLKDLIMGNAKSSGIDLYSMEEGEVVTFMAREASSRSTKKVTVTRGNCYHYSDYGYGSYLTYQYTVKFGNVSATAYCIQPEKSSPGTGTYDITKLSDGKKLAKVCYYGTKAAGDEGFFTEENGYGNLSAGARFILVHLAASYANGGDSAFSGASSKAKTLAMKLYNYCISQPEIPDVDMSFSDANVTAYVDGSSQRTKEITFKADKLQSITMKLPSGVKLHNVTTGKTSKAGEAVEISGGTKFYLSAPLTQVQDVAGSWSATMKGSVTKDYSAYKISTGSGSQDLALVFGEGVDDEKYVDFKVTWVQYAISMF